MFDNKIKIDSCRLATNTKKHKVIDTKCRGLVREDRWCAGWDDNDNNNSFRKECSPHLLHSSILLINILILIALSKA